MFCIPKRNCIISTRVYYYVKDFLTTNSGLFSVFFLIIIKVGETMNNNIHESICIKEYSRLEKDKKGIKFENKKLKSTTGFRIKILSRSPTYNDF